MPAIVPEIVPEMRGIRGLNAAKRAANNRLRIRLNYWSSIQCLGQDMEAIWEYRWTFVETGHWGGTKETNFWMTDEEAATWWAYGQPGTARIESTKRDRNAKIDASASFTGSMKPWDHGGVPY